ncbi:uncharacterized protein NEMAJ01_0248 [Nematocida major]|uniref:uncharacterized protein n=1 Tax=Nematocida major TaxID=1912982 RepID=UPI0020087688|nr:uncharacterized protein NEMAJ01_0248 [Nematocida major]KAH9385352.1 hypothetical protein NEMAJ01_0248 [Nematocida major]
MVEHMLQKSRKKQALLCAGVLIVALCAAGGGIFVGMQMREHACKESALGKADGMGLAPLGARAKDHLNPKACLKEQAYDFDAKVQKIMAWLEELKNDIGQTKAMSANSVEELNCFKENYAKFLSDLQRHINSLYDARENPKKLLNELNKLNELYELMKRLIPEGTPFEFERESEEEAVVGEESESLDTKEMPYETLV